MSKAPFLILAVLLSSSILIQPALAASDAEIEALSERIKSLEADLALLKRQKEVDDEKEKADAEKSASVEFGKKGLKITSPDKNFELSVRGYVQGDYRHFFDDESNTGRNEFIARRIRPTIEGKAGNASFRVMPDFAGSSTRIFDAHIDYKFLDSLQVRMGKFKAPIGLERLQSASDSFFIERGHPTNFVPNRDLGIQVYGTLIPDQLEYQVGVFNGTSDIGNTDNDSDDKKDIAARVFAHPFHNSDVVPLQGLGIGVGGSVGERDGSPTSTILGDYRTPGQQAFFRYRSGSTPTAANTVVADGTHWRLYPQAYWYFRNFGLLGEYAISNQEVTIGTSNEDLQHQAWQIAGSYVLTGENVGFKGGIKPEEDFNLLKNGWGAFELVGRIGETDVDDDAFPVFANPDTAASRATSVGTGVNWYLNENFKLQLNYDHTNFDGGATGGEDRPDEEALFSRAQMRF